MNNLNQQYFKTKETHKKNFNKYGWVLWIGLFLVFGYYTYKQIKVQFLSSGVLIKTTDKESCMIESEFQLGKIHYLDSTQQIIEKIGDPDFIEIDSIVNAHTWFYKEFEITIIQNHINFITSKDSSIATPHGIRIGLMKWEVDSILFGNKARVNKIIPGTKEIQFVNCVTEFYMVMGFEGNKLKELGMGLDVP